MSSKKPKVRDHLQVPRTVRETSIRTGIFGLGGGGGGGGSDLIDRKKLLNARKHVLYKCTQIAVKTKTLPILTSYESIIITKLVITKG